MVEVSNKNGENIIASPVASKTNEQPEEKIAQIDLEKPSANKSSISEAKNSQPLPIREKRLVVASDPVVKVPDNMQKTNSEKSPIVRNVKETNKENKKTTAAQKQQVPNLTTLDEEEDESLRLADLFDEIDAR